MVLSSYVRGIFPWHQITCSKFGVFPSNTVLMLKDRMIINPCLNVCVMVQPDKYLEAARHPSPAGIGGSGPHLAGLAPIPGGHPHGRGRRTRPE